MPQHLYMVNPPLFPLFPLFGPSDFTKQGIPLFNFGGNKMLIDYSYLKIFLDNTLQM